MSLIALLIKWSNEVLKLLQWWQASCMHDVDGCCFHYYTHCLCLGIWCLEKSEQDFCWGIYRLVIAAISVVMKGSQYQTVSLLERDFFTWESETRERRQEQNMMAHMWAASAAATLKKKNILHQSIMTTKSCAVINKVTLEQLGVVTALKYVVIVCYQLSVCLSFLKLHRNE